MSSMQEYLAAKSVSPSSALLTAQPLTSSLSIRRYMSGAKADAILARGSDGGEKKKKKRKRKDESSSTRVGGLVIEEEGASGWDAVEKEKEKDEDDAAPSLFSYRLLLRLSKAELTILFDILAVETTNRTFQKSSKSSWETVHTGDTPPPESADPVPEDEAPQIVATSPQPPSPPKRRAGGIRTAAEVRAEQAERLAEEEAARLAAGAEQAEEDARLAQETVYRDRSGKKVDMKAEKAEERRRKKEREEKEAAKMEWGKGIVQRGEREEAARRLEEEKGRDVARYVSSL
jgi:pre-mRNA-splicing factor CWC26